MSNYTKLLVFGMALAVLAASVRHYGDARTANQGYALGCLGYETVGEPGWFVDCGESEPPASVR